MHTSTALTDNYDKFTLFKEIIAVFIRLQIRPNPQNYKEREFIP